MVEKHCAPKDLSGIGGVVMRTWELLGECPRSLGKGRMWIWCCSFLGKSCPAFPPACPPHWGLNCMALPEVFPLFPFTLHVLIKWILSSVSVSCCFWNPEPVQWAPSQDMGLCHRTEIFFFSAAALGAGVFSSCKKQEWVTLWTNPKIYPKSPGNLSWKNWYPVDLCASSNLLANPIPSLGNVFWKRTNHVKVGRNDLNEGSAGRFPWAVIQTSQLSHLCAVLDTSLHVWCQPGLPAPPGQLLGVPPPELFLFLLSLHLSFVLLSLHLSFFSFLLSIHLSFFFFLLSIHLISFFFLVSTWDFSFWCPHELCLASTLFHPCCAFSGLLHSSLLPVQLLFPVVPVWSRVSFLPFLPLFLLSLCARTPVSRQRPWQSRDCSEVLILSVSLVILAVHQPLQQELWLFQTHQNGEFYWAWSFSVHPVVSLCTPSMVLVPCSSSSFQTLS